MRNNSLFKKKYKMHLNKNLNMKGGMAPKGITEEGLGKEKKEYVISSSR